MDMCWLKPNIESHSLIDPEAMRDSRRRAGKFPTTDLSFPEKEKRRAEQSRAQERERERESKRLMDGSRDGGMEGRREEKKRNRSLH